LGFPSLQHTRTRRSTCRELCLGPLRSALRVWLPSRRLTPSEPVPAFFHAGGAHGIYPSELSPPARYPRLSPTRGPTYRLARRCSRRGGDGPAQRAPVSGLSPLRESLAEQRGLASRPPDAPLGFVPHRATQHEPDPSYRPGSSHVLCELDASDQTTGTSEYHSAHAWFRPRHRTSRAAGETTLSGFLHL
jgi:hypothetical protein